MKELGVVYGVVYEGNEYHVFFQHQQFNKFSCEPEDLDTDGMLIFDRDFKEIPMEKYSEIESHILNLIVV